MNLADLNKLNTMSLTHRLRDAIWFAMTEHQGQLRKGGEPFILHCLRVMLSMDTGEEMIVAVLHDVVEDTDATTEDVRDVAGSTIALVVAGLTRRQGETYFDYIRRAALDEIAGKVKVADLTDNLHNLHQLPNQEEARFLDKRYNKALQILHELGFPQ